MKTQRIIRALLLYIALWLAWSVLKPAVVNILPQGALLTTIVYVLFEGVVWGLIPFLLLLKEKRLHELTKGKFPVFSCVILLCVCMAFLHTLRLLYGLQDTHVVFTSDMVVLSVAAGVIEEITFRGYFFTSIRKWLGFWLAAWISSLMFLLYHFPELITGQWRGLVSWRALLIFGMGIVFCWMTEKWKNLYLIITVHTVWDLLSCLFCLAG